MPVEGGIIGAMAQGHVDCVVLAKALQALFFSLLCCVIDA